MHSCEYSDNGEFMLESLLTAYQTYLVSTYEEDMSY